MKPSRLTLGAAVASVAAALVAGGCGSSSSSGTTPQAVTWADGVCAAVTSYKTSLSNAAATLKGGQLSKSTVEDALTSVKSATQDFTATLGEIGKPGTEAGQKATATIDELSANLQKDAQKIKESASGSTLSTVSVASSTLLTAQSQVNAAWDTLKALDPKGELHDAFSKAESCSSLEGS
jgi:hypothetical protein